MTEHEELIGWWPLHSNNPVDLSGFGNHGTNNGATPGVAGKGGLSAYSFGGSGDYISIGSTGKSGSSSFPLWVNPNSIGGYIFSNYTSGPAAVDGEVRIYFSTDSVSFSFYDGGWNTITGNYQIPTNEWTHIAPVWDESSQEAKIYINGDLDVSTTHNASMASAGQSWGIGATRDGSSGMDGVLSDVRVYNHALSSAEVQTLYEWGAGDYARPPVDGVAYYPLDGNATDQWGSNDGTVNGATVTNDAIRGQAYSFDGGNDYIDCGLSNDLKFENTDWTVAVWINPLYTNAGAIVSQADWETGCWRTRYDPGSSRVRLHWNGWGGDALDWNTTLTENVWHFLVYKMEDTGSGYRGTIYHNSEKKSSTVGSPPSSSSDSPVYIGNINGDSQDYEGKIDDVRLYNRALSPKEIHDLYRFGTRGRDMRAMTVRA